MATYQNDPRWMRARYPGKDRDGNPVKVGNWIFYYPGAQIVLTGPAAERASADFECARQDEEFYNG